MKQFILLIFFFCLASCSRQEANKHHIDDLSAMPCVQLSFTEHPLNALIGIPVEMAYVPPYLIFDNNIDGKSLFLCNLENDSCVSVISEGQGPDELLIPIEMQVKGRELYVMERRTGRCRAYSVDSLWNGIVKSSHQVVMPKCDRMARTADAYIGSGFDCDSMLTAFNEQSEVICRAKGYPEYLDQVSDPGKKYIIGQSRLAFNLQHHRLLVAAGYLNEINVYDYDDATHDFQKINTLTIGKNRLKDRILNEGDNISILGTDLRYSQYVCCSDNFFYILYKGIEMQKDSAPRYILRLTMDGALDRVYKTDDYLSSICVLPDDSKIYAIQLNKDLDYVLSEVELKERIEQ